MQNISPVTLLSVKYVLPHHLTLKAWKTTKLYTHTHTLLNQNENVNLFLLKVCYYFLCIHHEEWSVWREKKKSWEHKFEFYVKKSAKCCGCIAKRKQVCKLRKDMHSLHPLNSTSISHFSPLFIYKLPLIEPSFGALIVLQCDVITKAEMMWEQRREKEALTFVCGVSSQLSWRLNIIGLIIIMTVAGLLTSSKP